MDRISQGQIVPPRPIITKCLIAKLYQTSLSGIFDIAGLNLYHPGEAKTLEMYLLFTEHSYEVSNEKTQHIK